MIYSIVHVVGLVIFCYDFAVDYYDYVVERFDYFEPGRLDYIHHLECHLAVAHVFEPRMRRLEGKRG